MTITILIIMTMIIRFKYGNAVTNDLWTALSEVAQGRLDIKAIMDTWTRQMGYPVLQVKMKSPELPWSATYLSGSQVERSGPSSYRVRQHRYLTDSSLEGKGATSPYNYRWPSIILLLKSR